MKRRKYDWGAVDWKLPTKEIAEKLGVDKETVSRARKRLSPGTLGKKSALADLTRARNLKLGTAARWIGKSRDWKSVDWSKMTNQIAQELSTHKTYVSRMRKIFDPKTPRTPKNQLAYVRDWEFRHPKRAQARKNKWAKSAAGKAWLKKNQKKKNLARAAWRKRKRLEAK